jgi:hypothetical protein
MLRERYDPMNLFEYIPALGMATDAVLSQPDSLLYDDVLFQAVKADLVRRSSYLLLWVPHHAGRGQSPRAHGQAPLLLEL